MNVKFLFLLQLTSGNFMNIVILAVAFSKCYSGLDVKCHIFCSSGWYWWRPFKCCWHTKFWNAVSSDTQSVGYISIGCLIYFMTVDASFGYSWFTYFCQLLVCIKLVLCNCIEASKLEMNLRSFVNFTSVVNLDCHWYLGLYTTMSFIHVNWYKEVWWHFYFFSSLHFQNRKFWIIFSSMCFFHLFSFRKKYQNVDA